MDGLVKVAVRPLCEEPVPQQRGLGARHLEPQGSQDLGFAGSETLLSSLLLQSLKETLRILAQQGNAIIEPCGVVPSPVAIKRRKG